MIENEAKIIDNYLQYLLVNQIKKEQIVDILDTICILDTASGNKQPLDIDCLHSSKDSQMTRIVATSEHLTTKTLTDIGKLRLLSDSLFVASQMNGIEIPSGVVLTLKASSDLVKGYNAKEDADLTDCSKNLELFFDTLKKNAMEDLSWYYELEKKLKYYDSLMKKYECSVDLLDSITKKLNQSEIKYPFKNMFVEEVSIDTIDSYYKDDIRGYVEETICSAVLCAIIGKMKVWLEKNNVYANYCLLKIDRQNYNIGTYSKNNYIPRIDVLTGFPGYMVNRLKRIFPVDTPFDIEKLETMIRILIFISSKKTTDLTYDLDDMTVKA